MPESGLRYKRGEQIVSTKRVNSFTKEIEYVRAGEHRAVAIRGITRPMQKRIRR
jgi:hypothetical protein